MSEQRPDGILIARRMLTEDEFARLKAKWERKRHGHPKVLGQTRRVRLKWAATRAIDSTAIWLAHHGMLGLAELIWWRGCKASR